MPFGHAKVHSPHKVQSHTPLLCILSMMVLTDPSRLSELYLYARVSAKGPKNSGFTAYTGQAE